MVGGRPRPRPARPGPTRCRPSARPSSRPSGISRNSRRRTSRSRACPAAPSPTAAASRGPNSNRSSRRSSSGRWRRAGRRSRTRGSTASQVDEVVLVGGSTRIPLVRREVERTVRPHPAHRPQSRRGRGARRGRAGRHPRQRPPRDAAARRHAALARHRDHGRGGVEDHPAQLDHPGERQRDVHDVRRQPDGRRHPRPAGRARDGLGQPVARPVQAARHSADARRPAAHPGAVPDRRERHPERVGARTADRHRADDRGEAVLRPDRRGSRAHAARVVRARAGGRRRAAAHRGAQRGRDDHRGDREDAAPAGLRRDRRVAARRRANWRSSRPRWPT